MVLIDPTIGYNNPYVDSAINNDLITNLYALDDKNDVKSIFVSANNLAPVTKSADTSIKTITSNENTKFNKDETSFVLHSFDSKEKKHTNSNEKKHTKSRRKRLPKGILHKLINAFTKKSGINWKSIKKFINKKDN